MNNVLIIDDDRELCLLIKQSIRSEHMEADFCYTGKDGLTKLKEKKYQLVILDVMMPGMDGFETLEQIRKASHTVICHNQFHISVILRHGYLYFVSMAMRNYVLYEIIQYPHIPVHVKFYPERLFGNINMIFYLFVFKYRYPVNQNTPCQFRSFNGTFLMLLFAPMVLTVLGAWIISREYTEGTLKNIFTVPVSKTKFLCGKFLFFALLTFLFMLISWLQILVLALLCSCFIPVTELTVPSFLFFLVKMLYSSVLLCAGQTPFLYLTIRTKGFVAPLLAIAAIILVNVVLSNSGVAGFYPWSASYLLVTGKGSGYGCPKEISMFIILAMCLLGIIAGLLRFKREEVQ